MYCSSCGTRNLDDARFCVKCGVQMAHEAPPPAEAVASPAAPQRHFRTSPSRTRRRWIIAACVLAAAYTSVVLGVSSLVLGAAGDALHRGAYADCIAKERLFLVLKGPFIASWESDCAHLEMAVSLYWLGKETEALVQFRQSGHPCEPKPQTAASLSQDEWDRLNLKWYALDRRHAADDAELRQEFIALTKQLQALGVKGMARFYFSNEP